MTLSFPHLICRACGNGLPIGPHFAGCPHCREAGHVEPLEVTYDFDALRASGIVSAWHDMAGPLWRFGALLPLPPGTEPVSLVEGGTPLIRLPSPGPGRLWIKDETRNPTGAHKDRFHSVSISMARHLGLGKIATPTTGNHGTSAAAYAARAGMSALIFCDAQCPTVLRDLITLFGARIVVMPERASLMAWLVGERGWYPSTTLSPAPVATPFGVEGYKTIAFETFLQLGRRLPAFVVAPVAGGDLFYGIWKGYRELGRIADQPIGPLPRMVAAQSSGADPVIRAFRAGAHVAAHVRPNTVALSIGDATSTPVSLTALRESDGLAEAVPDQAIVAAVHALARLGIAAEPAGAAAVAVALSQQASGLYAADDDVVCLVTGSAAKWPDTIGLGVEAHVLVESRAVDVRAWVGSFDNEPTRHADPVLQATDPD